MNYAGPPYPATPTTTHERISIEIAPAFLHTILYFCKGSVFVVVCSHELHMKRLFLHGKSLGCCGRWGRYEASPGAPPSPSQSQNPKAMASWPWNTLGLSRASSPAHLCRKLKKRYSNATPKKKIRTVQ